MERYSFLNLLGNAFLRLAVGWIECIVVAIGAAACSFGSVAVWTTETCIERDFLNALTESPAEIFVVRIVSSMMSPGVMSRCHRIKEEAESKVGFYNLFLCDTL